MSPIVAHASVDARSARRLNSQPRGEHEKHEVSNRANTNDILFVAAAGNAASNNDVTPSYPASYNTPNMVAVAATDNRDGLASFSNYGPTSVHLGAPGVDVLSTTPGADYVI
jgi:subtilisin family serine protease